MASMFPNYGVKSAKSRLDSPSMRLMAKPANLPPRVIAQGAPPVPQAVPQAPRTPQPLAPRTMRDEALSAVETRYGRQPNAVYASEMPNPPPGTPMPPDMPKAMPQPQPDDTTPESAATFEDVVNERMGRESPAPHGQSPAPTPEPTLEDIIGAGVEGVVEAGTTPVGGTEGTGEWARLAPYLGGVPEYFGTVAEATGSTYVPPGTVPEGQLTGLVRDKTTAMLEDEPGISDEDTQAALDAIWSQAQKAAMKQSDMMAAAGVGGTGSEAYVTGDVYSSALDEARDLMFQSALAEEQSITARLGMLLDAGFKDKSLQQQAEEFAKTFGLDEKKFDAWLSDNKQANAWQSIVNMMAASGAKKMPLDVQQAVLTMFVDQGKSPSEVLAWLVANQASSEGKPKYKTKNTATGEDTDVASGGGGDPQAEYDAAEAHGWPEPPPDFYGDPKAWDDMPETNKAYYWDQYVKAQASSEED